MREVIGIDLYNQSMTGWVSKTMSNRATDSDHVPCVLITERENHELPNQNRADNGKLASRQLLRTGCIQRYADNGEQEWITESETDNSTS